MFVDFATMWLAQLAGHPVWLALAMIGATFVLEDAATVAVGLLASQMVLDPTSSVLTLLVGTILGDLALYVAGRVAADTYWGRNWRARSQGRSAESFLRARGDLMLIVARFTPGLRLPVYSAAGFLGLPAARVAGIIAVMSAIWTPGLFWLSATLGEAAAKLPGAFAVVLVLGVALSVSTSRLSQRWFARA